MIPRIAHFHWTGKPMTWLRWAGVASFARWNPDWDFRMHRTPPDMRKYGMRYCNEGDWVWWRALAEEGGWQVATDIVFVKPVPEEWLDCQLNVCTNGTERIYQIAMSGAVAGHPLMVEAERRCADMPNKGAGMSDQVMGVELLRQLAVPKHFDQPMDGLCHFNFTQVDQMWKDVEYVLPESAIGVHWYGGDPQTSMVEEPQAKPGHPSYIVKLAEKMFP